MTYAQLSHHEAVKSPTPAIILGSSRSNGKTFRVIQDLFSEQNVPLFDLKKMTIQPFDYQHHNHTDDFFPLMKDLFQYNTWVLATPVYWYTMSGIMKTFLDRWTDFLSPHNLALPFDPIPSFHGRRLFVVASYGTSMPLKFEDAFAQTCGYLNMEYGGCYFSYTGENKAMCKGESFCAKSFLQALWNT